MEPRNTFADINNSPKYTFQMDQKRRKILTEYSIYFAGIPDVNMSECQDITSSGLQYLKGVHVLNLSSCDQIYDSGLENLKGIHSLDLS